MSNDRRTFNVGTRVWRGHYGNGEIIQIDPNDHVHYYLIKFDNGCRKWFPSWELLTEAKEHEHRPSSKGTTENI